MGCVGWAQDVIRLCKPQIIIYIAWYIFMGERAQTGDMQVFNTEQGSICFCQGIKKEKSSFNASPQFPEARPSSVHALCPHPNKNGVQRAIPYK
jgi:hypothetical protein